MDCAKVQQVIALSRPGNGGLVLPDVVQQHARDCAPCHDLLRQARMIGDLLQTWKAPAPSEDLPARILRRVKTRRPARVFTLRSPLIGAAAALLLCLGGAALFWALSGDANQGENPSSVVAVEKHDPSEAPIKVEQRQNARFDHQQAPRRAPFTAPLPASPLSAPSRSGRVSAPESAPAAEPAPLPASPLLAPSRSDRVSAPEPAQAAEPGPLPVAPESTVEAPAPELLENLDAFLLMTRLGVDLADVETMASTAVSDDAAFFAHLDLYSVDWEDE